MSTAPTFLLRLDEATELGELLEFVCDWLGQAPVAVSAALASFVGTAGYDISDLRADCRRFAFLLSVATSLVVGEEGTR